MRRSLILVAVVALVLSAGSALPVKAAGKTYYVKPDGAGTTCSEWLAACSLQRALDLAGSGDEVWLAAGTYFPSEPEGMQATFAVGDGLSIYGGFVGGETSIAERDVAANATILSGDLGDPIQVTDNAVHVVTIPAMASVLIDGLTITSGEAMGFLGYSFTRGAGILNEGSLTLHDVTMLHNSATEGGAIYSTGALAIGSSAIIENSGFRGGGVFVAGGSLTTQDTTFSGNSVMTSHAVGNDPSSGGALYVAGTANATIKNVTFAHNRADLVTSIAMADTASATVRNSLLANPVQFGKKQNGVEVGAPAGTSLSLHRTAVRGGCSPVDGLTCDNTADVSPITTALADNGGPTLTIDPAGEPAIAPVVVDQGDDATCTSVDQRGVARPFEGDGVAPSHCDLGAVEHVPLAIEFADATTQAPEAAGNASLKVTLENPFLDQVSVLYAMTGTASSPADYTPVSGTLNFVPGDTSETITLDVVDDNLDEDNETVIVTLSNPVIGTLGPASVATHTIVDDDVPPVAQFAAISGSASESRAHPGALVVTLSRRSGRTVTVPYAARPGSAQRGRDFRLPAGALTFPAGTTRMKVPLEIIDDFLVEPAESLSVELGTPANAELGTRRHFSYVILDNDRGTCDGRAATLAGTMDSDVITGTPGVDVIVGGGGDDTIDGRGGADVICGDDGRDRVEGGPGRDSLFGGDGADVLDGGDAGDHLDGGEANDRLHGDAGDDDLTGAGGNDVLFGDGGNDELAGGGGTDRCNGGPGIDESGANDGCEVRIGIP